MNRLLDRIRTELFRFAACRCSWSVAGLVRAMSRTWRYDVSGRERLEEARACGRGLIYCFWHGRMLELAVAHADRKIGVLVSSHPDGMAAAGIIASLGYVPVRVSRLGNSVAGIRRMLRFAENGGDLALTPDAHSREHRVHPGAVALARLSGHALVPVAATARPVKRVVSWDRFEVPWPGARVSIRYGTPLLVPTEAEGAGRERIRHELESTLHRLHAELDGGFEERPVAVRERIGVALRR